MKSKIVISLFVFLISFSQTSARRIEFGDFNRILSKHGNWVNVDRGGLVWTPINVERGWKPYTNGRWFWTEFGWFWDSDEQFGWITHHYGRWDYDDYYGWVWHPGYEWAPAWVKWRVSGDYIGWRPLTPSGRFSASKGLYFEHPVSIHFSAWNFLSIRDLNNRHLGKHFVRKDRLKRLYRYSKAASNYYIMNNVVFCDIYISNYRLRGIKNDIKIINIDYTNDFDRISKFRNSYGKGIPIRWRSKINKYKIPERKRRSMDETCGLPYPEEPLVPKLIPVKFTHENYQRLSKSRVHVPKRVEKGKEKRNNTAERINN